MYTTVKNMAITERRMSLGINLQQKSLSIQQKAFRSNTAVWKRLKRAGPE